MDWDLEAAKKTVYGEEDPLQQRPAAPTAAAKAAPSSTNFDRLIEEEGASHLAPVIKAIYGQETGSGANNRTSIDGAKSGMQVIPATFNRFADKGWDINNDEHGMRAGIRYAKYLGDKFGDDPAKIAAGYFSGEGNVPRDGQGAYLRDAKDGNGKRVSGYVADVQRRMGAGQQPAAPAYPKWSEVAAKPEYKALDPEQQDAARRQYFVENIVPQLPTDQIDAAWSEFDVDSKPKSNTERVIERGKETLSKITGNVLGTFGESKPASVMEAVPPSASAKAPVVGMSESGYNKTRTDFLAMQPEQLQRISQQGGVMGQVAERVLQEKGAYAEKVQQGLATKTDDLRMGVDTSPTFFERRKAAVDQQLDQAKSRILEVLRGDGLSDEDAEAEFTRMRKAGVAPPRIMDRLPEYSTKERLAGDRGAWGLYGEVGVGALSSIGSSLSYIGRTAGMEGMQQFGDALLKTAGEKTTGDDSFSTQLAQGVGSMASFFLPGIGVARGASALATVAPVAAKWLGAGAMAGLEAAAEADNTYKELIKQGYDANSASDKAGTVFWANMALLGVTDKVGFFNDMRVAYEKGGMQILKDVAKKAGVASLSEGLQEGVQQVVQNAATNKPLGEGVGTSMAIGAIVGGGASAVLNAATTPMTKEARLAQAIEDDSTKMLTGRYLDETGKPAGGEPPRKDTKAERKEPTLPETPVDVEAAEAIPPAINPIADELATLERAPAVTEEEKQHGEEIAKALKPAYGSGSVSIVRPEALPDRTAEVDGRRQLGKDEYADLEQLGQLFGKKVVLFDSSNDQHPDAFVRRSDNDTIYLNTKAADASHSVLFGHELDHLVEREAPEIHKAWREAVLAAAPDLAQRAGEFYPNPVNPQTGKPLLTTEAHQAEIVADLMGNRFAEPEFRQTLFNNLAVRSDGRTVLKKVLEHIQGLIERVKTLGPMKKFKADELVTDLKKVRREAARALGRYVVEREKAKQAGSGAGVQASSARDTYPEYLPLDKLTQDRLLERGADGHLTSARERYIPIEKIDGLEPTPAASDERGYEKGRPVTQPVEVRYDKDSDTYVLYAGNHRVTQAKTNGDRYVRAFVEPDRGSVGASATTLRSKAGLPGGVIASAKRAPKAPELPDLKKVRREAARALGRYVVEREKAKQAGVQAAAKRVTVEGVERAAENSLGKRIGKSRADAENFWKWFGDGTLRTEDGRPLVLYHGTTRANARSIRVFRRSKTGAMGSAVYLGDSPEASAGYDQGAMIKVYAKGKYLNNAQWTEYVNKHGWSGAEAAARADGWSGVYDQKFENAIAVWDPADIKSATGNSGAFDPANPDITAAAKRAPELPDLIITHNLSAANLMHAVKMGGIPVPSLAVTKKDNALTGFGEITLLGNKSMADPKGYAGTKVFGADIYSPRYPSVEYHLTPNMRERADALLAEGEKATGSTVDWDEVKRRGATELERQPAFRWKFLTERGVEPKIVRDEPAEFPKGMEAFKEDTRPSYELRRDPDVIKAAVEAYRAEIRAAHKEGRVSKDEYEVLTEVDESGERAITARTVAQLHKWIDTRNSTGKVDRYKTRYAMEEQVRSAGMQDDLSFYADEFMRDLNPNEKIFQGFTNAGNRKYIDHTLENVVKILKKELRGGENFNYGVGSLRAKFTPQFKSIAQIKASKDRLITKEAFEKVEAEIDTEFLDVARALDPNASLDTITAVLEDGAKLGLQRAAKEYRIEPTEEALQQAAKFLGKLHSLPTEYFEAKILRDVDLAEFSGAVVPEGVRDDVLKALRSRGVKEIETYAKGDEKARGEAVKKLAERLQEQGGDVLFSAKRVTETPEFKKWFGDSKVVDENGKPLVVYHGTSATTLTEFDDAMSGSTMASASGLDGFYFTADPDTANLYAKHSEKAQHQMYGRFYNRQNIVPVFLSMQNPLVYKKQKGDQITLLDTLKRSIISEAKVAGHDGVIFKGFRDTPTGRGAKVADVFVAFKPAQIKSATGNSGAFDPADPDITASTKRITVDGVERPTENSLGKPIHPTEEGVRNFWRWFGEEGLVDDDGAPIVVYHGGGKDFNQVLKNGRFGESIFVREGRPSGYGVTDYALFLRGKVLSLGDLGTELETEAGENALRKAAGKDLDENQIEELRDALTADEHYPESESVWELIGAIDEADAQVEIQKLRGKVARELGASAVQTPDEFDGETWLVVNKHAVKSATGNSGAFDPANPDITASTKRDPELINKAIDRAIAREQGRPVTELKRESATLKLRALRNKLDAGKITEGQFIAEASLLSKRLDLRAVEKDFAEKPGRARGADYLRERILQSKRWGDMSEQAADLAEWFIQKNPALVDELGISVRTPRPEEKGSAGRYDPLSRVIHLMRGSMNEGTAVHEILHHLERLMPAEMQDAIREEWMRAVQAEHKAATKRGDKAMLKYIELATTPSLKAIVQAGTLIQKGEVPRSAYPLLNASEFWAVRMTEVAKARYAADSVWAKSVQWLKEALQHIKGALGLRSDAPLLRALNDLLESGTGRMKSKQMLGFGLSYEQPVWHGSPHKFDKFSTENIGTGEGAQAYGWGLYFAGKKGVAEWYREALSRANPAEFKVGGITEFTGTPDQADPRQSVIYAVAMGSNIEGLGDHFELLGASEKYVDGIRSAVSELRGKKIERVQKPAGALYQVEIPEDDEYLLWDKPLSEQPEKVRAVVEPLMQDEVNRRNEERERLNAASPGRLNHPVIGKLARKVYTSSGIKGQAAYEAISKQMGSDKAASEYLHSLGIAGIKYLDGTSRDAGDGSYNYVVFDDSRVQITDVQAAAKRITVDGVERPTENSLGKPIHPTEEGVRNFWKWFGDSKAVDKEGRPLVVYHGSTADIRAFDPAKADGRLYSGGTTGTVFFTDNPDVGASYAGRRTSMTGLSASFAEGGNISVAYLRIAKPLKASAKGDSWRDVQFKGEFYSTAELTEVAKQAKKDGLIVSRVLDYRDSGPTGDKTKKPSTTFAVFSPEQIKSATGNSGAFDPADPDITASVIRKALDARDNTLRKLDAAIDGLSNLPDQFDYLKDRYRTLGKIARVDEITSQIRDGFKSAGPADKQAVYDFLTNANARSSQIGPADLRDLAERLKKTINYVGDQLVARGLLDPAVRAQFKDQYLPRMYLKHLMSNQDWKILGAGKKPSDMGYLKQRKDIPEEVRDLVLGEIKDPAFLGANAIGRSMRDLAILDWLGKISQNGNWVFPGVMLDFKGQQVSAYYLKAEADRIEGQIPHYTPANQAKAKQLVADMRGAARTALANLDVDHTLYKQIPDTQRYGLMRGLYVRKEIFNDIMGMSAAVNPDPTWFEKVFGMGHIGTKLTQYWKFTKVALNPPGQVRNFVSNMVMLQLSGIPLHKLPLRFADAVRDIRRDGPYWKIAKKYGVTESTFNAQELYRIKDDLLSLEASARKNPLTWMKHTAAVVFNKVSDAYQFTEALGKTMKIIDVMKAGGTEEEAALEAQKWLFDYSLVPQWARIARNSPVGMPFITYSLKVFPRLIEVAATAPWRLLPWVGLLYGMAYYAAATFGVGMDDLDKLKKALPEWLQDKGFAAFLPMKDGNGRVQVLDMSYFFPWTFYTDLSKHAMEGKGGKVLQDLAGMFSSPVIGSSANLVANYDSFTKKPIYNPADPASYQAAAIANYLYDLMAPPIISSHGVASPMGLFDKQYGGKLVQGVTGTTNKFGDPRATTQQALWSAVGVNFYGMDPEHTRAANLLTMSRKVQDAENRLKSKLYDRSLTEQQRAKAVADYKERMLELGQEAKKYAEESQVPEAVKARK